MSRSVEPLETALTVFLDGAEIATLNFKKCEATATSATTYGDLAGGILGTYIESNS